MSRSMRVAEQNRWPAFDIEPGAAALAYAN